MCSMPIIPKALPFDTILLHTSWVPHNTGYAFHARGVFTPLNKYIPVRVRNFAYVPNIDHLTKEQKDMTIFQTWNDPPYQIGTPYDRKVNEKILNVILLETNHFWYYEKYDGPKIAYNVWESTRQPEEFFQKLLEFDQLWVPTEWQKKCSIEQGYPEDKIFVVPEGVGAEFNSTGVNLNQQHDIGKTYADGRFKFLIFGRWDYRKSITEMIRSFLEEFKEDEPVDLIISCDNPFPVDGYNSTEERLTGYGLQDPRIKILHFPHRDEYIVYLKLGHVLLSCSRAEGWNLPLIEAIASGIPTICSSHGAQLEFAQGISHIVATKEYKAPENVFMQTNTPGVWDEPNFEDFKKKMRYVYENYDECKQRALEGSEKVRKDFTWENAAIKAMIAIEQLGPKDSRIKLNIGEEKPKFGHENINKPEDILKMKQLDNSVDEINSSRALERFNKNEVPEILKEWFRVLKWDGKLNFEVLNFEWALANFLSKPANERYDTPIDTLLGSPEEKRKMGFTQDKIKSLLVNTGFSDIKVEDVLTQDQQCYHVTATKREQMYNDDVFILDSWPDSPEKVEMTLKMIEKLRKYGKPIALVTHYPQTPVELIQAVDYYIYDKNNIISNNWSLNYWYTIPNKVKVVSSYENEYHGAACLSSLKNATEFLKHRFKFAHFIEFDIDADIDTYLKRHYTQRANGKKFTGFFYDKHEKLTEGLDITLGIITNLFSFDLSWMSEKMIQVKSWEDYTEAVFDIERRTKRRPDFIWEHWMHNYFDDRGMIQDAHLFPSPEKLEIIKNRNMVDMGKNEPVIRFFVSEMKDHKMILFIINHGDVEENYIVEKDGEIDSGILKARNLHYTFFDKTDCKIKCTAGGIIKEFEISSKKTYTQSRFKFYNDEYECLEWYPLDSKGFVDVPENIMYTFHNGAKVEIKGESNDQYNVMFIDHESGLVQYRGDINTNCWISCGKKYYIDWRIEITKNGKPFKTYRYDLKDKNVIIHLSSSSMGDTIAWIPYALEFQRKHGCKVHVSTFFNKMFIKMYPELIFMQPGTPVNPCYAIYEVGCRDNDYDSNKNHWRLVPLQQVATDYLGLDYIEIKPKVYHKHQARPQKNKYVAISEFSTLQCKFWNNPKGWPNVIAWLKNHNYDVMAVSKEATHSKHVINSTNMPIEETINNIYHSEFFIGVGSGLSWLAWALGKKVFLISGFSEDWCEMKDCSRIINKDCGCYGCFNDKEIAFDRGNWNWCPRSKNFVCSRSISEESVISEIENYINTSR